MTTASASFRQLTLAVLTTLIGASSALAAPPQASAEAQARYQRDLAECNSGQSNQTAVTCRQEAASALAEAQRGAVRNQPDQYQANALRRCDAHQGDDRVACEARILDQGDITRGARAGGVLRQSITVTPAPAN